MGKLSRSKGAKAERAVVNLAKAAGFEKAERSAPMQAGFNQSDQPDVVNVGPLWIESKHAKTLRSSWMREALDVERPGFVNVVVWRDGGIGPENARATLLYSDLLKLVAMAYGPKGITVTEPLDVEDIRGPIQVVKP